MTTRPAWLWVLLGVLACLSAGCPSGTTDDDTAGDDDAGDDDDTGGGLTPCGFADGVAGTIEVYERLYSAADEDWRSSITGRIDEAPDPVVHEVAIDGGVCRYLQLDLGYCDPPCNYDEVCTPAGECQAWPAGLAAGDLSVEVAGQTFVLEAEEYNPGGYTTHEVLPDDLFAAGDPVRAELSGDVFPAVMLEAVGVAPLETELSANGVGIVAGEERTLTWTPGPDPGACVRSRLLGTNRYGGHGMPLEAMVICETSDTGALTIPAQMISWMVLQGPFGMMCVGYDCPPSDIERYTRAAAETEMGTVELRVHSHVTFYLDDG